MTMTLPITNDHSKEAMKTDWIPRPAKCAMIVSGLVVLAWVFLSQIPKLNNLKT